MLKITLKNQTKEAEIQLDDNESAIQDTLIQQTFSFLETNQDYHVKTDDDLDVSFQQAVNELNDLGVAETEQKKTATPLTDSKHRSSFSIAELFEKSTSHKSFVDQNGKERVNDCKCEYHCPHCRYHGIRYLPFGFRFTFCEKCGTKMFLRSATGGPWGEKDENNNVYIASETFDC